MMPAQHNEAIPPSAAEGRFPTAKAFLLAGAALLLALALYGWSSWSSPRDGKDAQQEITGIGANALRAMNDAPQVAVELAAKLEKSPDDYEGWALLARTYAQLGQHDKAKAAFQKAFTLRDTDAGLLADYADTLAFLNNQNFAGEPEQVIARALRLDPHNKPALMLAGLAAFDRKQYAVAISNWEKVVQEAGATTQIGVQAQQGIDAARKRTAQLP